METWMVVIIVFIAWAKENKKVSRTPESLRITVNQGENITKVVSFKSNRDLKEVELWFTPYYSQFLDNLPITGCELRNSVRGTSRFNSIYVGECETCLPPSGGEPGGGCSHVTPSFSFFLSLVLLLILILIRRKRFFFLLFLSLILCSLDRNQKSDIERFCKKEKIIKDPTNLPINPRGCPDYLYFKGYQDCIYEIKVISKEHDKVFFNVVNIYSEGKEEIEYKDDRMYFFDFSGIQLNLEVGKLYKVKLRGGWSSTDDIAYSLKIFDENGLKYWLNLDYPDYSEFKISKISTIDVGCPPKIRHECGTIRNGKLKISCDEGEIELFPTESGVLRCDGRAYEVQALLAQIAELSTVCDDWGKRGFSFFLERID